MTTLRIVVLGCVLAAVAITLKIRLDTPQGPQPLARAIVTTHLHKLRGRDFAALNRGLLAQFLLLDFSRQHLGSRCLSGASRRPGLARTGHRGLAFAGLKKLRACRCDRLGAQPIRRISHDQSASLR